MFDHRFICTESIQTVMPNFFPTSYVVPSTHLSPSIRSVIQPWNPADVFVGEFRSMGRPPRKSPPTFGTFTPEEPRASRPEATTRSATRS